MTWDVEYTEEFGGWWESLTAEEQESIAVSVRLLEERGPRLDSRIAALSMAHVMGICES